VLIAYKGLKLWRFDNTIIEFWAYDHCECAQTPIYELPVKNLTSPIAIRFDDPHFQQQGNNSSVRMHVRYVLASSLVRMRKNSINSASGLKTALTIVFSDHDFSKRTKIVANWQHYKRVLCIFSMRMRRNGYLGDSGKKIWPSHSLQRHRFSIIGE